MLCMIYTTKRKHYFFLHYFEILALARPGDVDNRPAMNSTASIKSMNCRGLVRPNVAVSYAKL